MDQEQENIQIFKLPSVVNEEYPNKIEGMLKTVLGQSTVGCSSTLV